MRDALPALSVLPDVETISTLTLSAIVIAPSAKVMSVARLMREPSTPHLVRKSASVDTAISAADDGA
jgi:hypothetical protein